MLAAGVSHGVDWGASIVVSGAEGETFLRSPLPRSGEFRIKYLHSYYREPAVETFEAGPGPSFRLQAVSSPSEAVLDYYEIQGTKTTEPGAGSRWLRLVPREPQRFEALPLIASAKGRKTLVLPDREVPLFVETGPSAHLVLKVEEDGIITETMGLFGR